MTYNLHIFFNSERGMDFYKLYEGKENAEQHNSKDCFENDGDWLRISTTSKDGQLHQYAINLSWVESIELVEHRECTLEELVKEG